MESCLTCKFSRQSGELMRCLRKSPTGSFAVWPIVERDNWCGEYASPVSRGRPKLSKTAAREQKAEELGISADALRKREERQRADDELPGLEQVVRCEYNESDECTADEVNDALVYNNAEYGDEFGKDDEP